ncbi:S8 family serine peptidase [Actinomadura syzygii]|uniref:S8 family serine peptidase n=1 Tax=Actinomadura syzygii TaxID=1427538 RepID=UPI003609C8DD
MPFSVRRAVVAVPVLLVAGAPLLGVGVGAAAGAAPRIGGCAEPAADRSAETPWAQQALAPERAWNLTRGEGIVVAVLGTGADGDVPQLRGRVRPGRDVTSGGRADDDCAGSGTFAAGIVAARPVTGVGFAGVAPGATVLPVRVARDGEEPTATGLAAGIDAAVAGGAKVISVAVPPVAGNARLARAVADAAARDVLVVAPALDDRAAAGPDRDAASRRHPAAYPAVVAVAGTDQAGTPVGAAPGGAPAGSGSAAGDRSAARVDLAAPAADLVGLGVRGPGQVADSGGEYAAAYVAGTAALVRAYRPEESAARVKRRLLDTATRPGARVPDPGVGWGTVNPVDAVGAVIPGERAAGRAPSVALPERVPADERAVDRALTLVMVVSGAVVVVGVVAAVVRSGRGQGWRPGGRDAAGTGREDTVPQRNERGAQQLFDSRERFPS